MDQHNIINRSTQNTPQQHQHTTTAPAFHHPNGFPPSPAATRAPSADIEMVSFNVTSYTSLRDILPSSTSPGGPVAFPRPPSYESAWCEIPIKNPLVKHAAIAYLQPMSSAPAEAEGKGILAAIMDRCGYVCCGIQDEDEGWCCLWWFGDIVSRVGLGRNGPPNNYPEAEDEDEEDDCEVVDPLRIQCLDRLLGREGV